MFVSQFSANLHFKITGYLQMFLTLTNDMRMVHILVREYTASNP